MTVMIIVAVAIFGIIFGSFVNALVWRLHEQDELVGKTGKKAVARRRALSITTGRSMCSVCGHELAPKDLVPVLSWVWLKGKCRYCHAAIPDSPLVELASGLLFVLSYAAWPQSFHGVGLFEFILWLVFLVGFVALAVYDIRWFLLPDKIVLPLTLLAVLQTVVVALWLRDWHKLWLPALSAMLIFGLFWLLYQISKGRWIGGGDVKLALVLGLLVGTPLQAFLVIFLASLIGTLASIPLLMQGKKGMQMHIPFGPYLLAATILVVLYGAHLVAWYQSLLLG